MTRKEELAEQSRKKTVKKLKEAWRALGLEPPKDIDSADNKKVIIQLLMNRVKSQDKIRDDVLAQRFLNNEITVGELMESDIPDVEDEVDLDLLLQQERYEEYFEELEKRRKERLIDDEAYEEYLLMK